MTFFPNRYIDSMQSQSKSAEIDKLPMKFTWKLKGYRTVKTALEMKEKVRGLTNTTCLEDSWNWLIKTHVALLSWSPNTQWVRIEHPEIKPQARGGAHVVEYLPCKCGATTETKSAKVQRQFSCYSTIRYIWNKHIHSVRRTGKMN